jgi:hypothetical protein|tara:strand:- start:1548 stop:1793 length:246 start_codon:yes stop_codon:yes gene_type:complete
MFLIEWIKGLFSDKDIPVPAKVETVKKPKKATAVKGSKVTKAELGKLTKAQLETEGRKAGVELDKRKKKADLVNELHKVLK